MTRDDAGAGVPLSPCHWGTLFWQWLKHPRSKASVAPSGRQLGRLMAGVLTGRRLSYRRTWRRHGSHYAGVGAAWRHAAAPAGSGNESGLAYRVDASLSAIASCLWRCPPFERASERERSVCLRRGRCRAKQPGLAVDAHGTSARHTLGGIQRLARRGGIQYTYGLSSPLHEDVCKQLGLICTSAGTAWRNHPPCACIRLQEAMRGCEGSRAFSPAPAPVPG